MSRSLSPYSDPEMEEVEEEGDDEVEILSQPPADRNTAPSSPHLAAPTAAAYGSKCTPTTAKKTAARYSVPPEYGLCAPSGDERAHDPPPGYAAIYTDHFKNGLRLPLPPFVVSVLAHYRIALAQLSPNSAVPLLGFLSICRRLSIAPTMSLFRYFFQLRRNTTDTEGWYYFHPRTLKIVYGPSLSMRRWKSSFLFFKTAPVSENHPNLSWSWNYPPIRDPLPPEHEWPSEETVDRFKANIVVRKLSRHSGEEERMTKKGIRKAATEVLAKNSSKENEPIPIPTVKATTNAMENPKTASTESLNADCRQEKMKRVAEVYATKPAKALKGPSGKKCVDGYSQLPSVPGLKHLTTEQFARFIQKSVCSFNLQLQGDKEELEKVVEAKDHDLKDRENKISSLQGDKMVLEKENASLKGDKKELEKENALHKGEKKELEKENASLKAMVSQLQGISDDRGPLLKVYTWKLLKTQGFTEFFYKLTTSVKRLGRHEAAELMRDRYPDIPEEALADLEDPLAALKLDNLFYDMIQDDGFEFPLLNHLLSLEEIPSSSQLKDLAEDEDPDALIAPSPLLF